MRINLTFTVCLAMLAAFTCRSGLNDGKRYSFFVAGHTYGNPYLEQDTSLNTVGFHTPFQAKFQSIRNNDDIKFGILTGDLVWLCTQNEWDAVDAEFKKIGKKVYIAAGNHDLANRQLFESRYGPTYYSFINEGDLFIVLDPSLSHWNIEGAQLDFLKKTVAQHSPNVANVFVFFHQVLWWSPNNKFSKLILNSTEGRADTINFWTAVEPLFHQLPNKVYMFAGDIGAFPSRSSVVYHQYDNISLIASGMGGGVNDNFIIVSVDEEKRVHFKLIALNYDSEDALGSLEQQTY